MATDVAQFDLKKYDTMLRTSGLVALRQVAMRVTELYNQMLSPTGLCVWRFGILRVCCQHGPISVDGLMRELVTTNRRVILRGLQPLVKNGLIERRRNEANRRQFVHELTPEGRQALAQAIQHWEEAQRAVIDQFGTVRWSELESELSALTLMNG